MGLNKKILKLQAETKIFANFFLKFPIAKTNNRTIFTNTIPLITYNNKIFKTFF